MNTIKLPHVHVRMVGEDGNCFAILGRVSNAMKRANIGRAQREAFLEEATSGDYNHLLATVMAWVNVDVYTDEEDAT